MNNTTKSQESNRKFGELYLITRALVLLAFLTGLLYLRVFIVNGLPAAESRSGDPTGMLMLVLLVVATLGLVTTWRWQQIGGLIAILGGLGLVFLSPVVFTDIPALRTFFYSSPFIIAGGLSLICGRREQKERETNEA